MFLVKGCCMKRILIIIAIMIITVVLQACLSKRPIQTSVVRLEVDERTLEAYYYIGDFDLSSLRLTAFLDDGTYAFIELDERMIPNFDRIALSYEGTHHLRVEYLGFEIGIEVVMRYDRQPVVENHYDLIVFSGQSNMQGFPYLSAPLIDMAQSAMEYRYTERDFAQSFTNNGERIICQNPYTSQNFNCTRPSSASSSQFVLEGTLYDSHPMIIGSSMVPHFTRAYESFGKQTYAMHIAEGATAISEWLRTEDLQAVQQNESYLPLLMRGSAFWLENCQDFDGYGHNHSNQRLVDLCRRAYMGQIRNDVMMTKIDEGIHHFESTFPDKVINHKVFVWNQGDRDADQMVDTHYPEASKAMYKESFLALWRQLKQERDFDLAVLVRMGLWGNLERDAIVMAAQEELAAEHEDIIIGTRAMSYFPHYRFNEDLGHGERVGYLQNVDIQPMYEKTRDTYYIGNHNNRHVNDRGNEVLGERTAENVFRHLYLGLSPSLEDEIIDEVTSYLNIPVERVYFDQTHYEVIQDGVEDVQFSYYPNHANITQLHFESSDETIAVINDGILYGFSPGQVKITVRNNLNAWVGEVSVTVYPRDPNVIYDYVFLDLRTPLTHEGNQSMIPKQNAITINDAMIYDDDLGAYFLNRNQMNDRFATGISLAKPVVIKTHETDFWITIAFESYRAINSLYYTSSRESYYGEGVYWLGGTNTNNFTARFANQSAQDNQNAWRLNKMDETVQKNPHIYLISFRLSKENACDLIARKYTRDLETGKIQLVEVYNHDDSNWLFSSGYGNEKAVINQLVLQYLFVQFGSQLQRSDSWVSFFRVSYGLLELEEMAPWLISP